MEGFCEEWGRLVEISSKVKDEGGPALEPCSSKFCGPVAGGTAPAPLLDGVHGDDVLFNDAVVAAPLDAPFGVCAEGKPRCEPTVRGLSVVFRA